MTTVIMSILCSNPLYNIDDMMYWKRDTPAPNSPKRRAPSAEIEITSYALMSILTKDELVPINSVMPIVRWLTHQRNAYGGFTSTQVY